MDLTTYFFNSINPTGIAAGESTLDIIVRLTVDERLIVKEVEDLIRASPYAICRVVNDIVTKLARLQIGPSWRFLVMRIDSNVLNFWIHALNALSLINYPPAYPVLVNAFIYF